MALWALAQDDPAKNANYEAEFVINLIENIEWPSKSGVDTSKVFVISVLGDSAFCVKLRQVAEKKSTKKLKVEVKTVSLNDNLSGSRILFIATDKLAELAKALKKVGSLPILTVTDSKGFARYGVMIELLIEKGQLAFIVNRMVLNHSSLKISPKLLKQAKKTLG